MSCESAVEVFKRKPGDQGRLRLGGLKHQCRKSSRPSHWEAKSLSVPRMRATGQGSAGPDGLFVKPYPPPAPLPSFTTDQSEGGMASCHPGASRGAAPPRGWCYDNSRPELTGISGRSGMGKPKRPAPLTSPFIRNSSASLPPVQQA